ncbi:MAG: hypothetical protein H7Z10_15575 [Gemmatimonadaceae bacterium]|nr:hypothetical protein [Acetobacteraceae bacterium]
MQVESLPARVCVDQPEQECPSLWDEPASLSAGQATVVTVVALAVAAILAMLV